MAPEAVHLTSLVRRFFVPRALALGFKMDGGRADSERTWHEGNYFLSPTGRYTILLSRDKFGGRVSFAVLTTQAGGKPGPVDLAPFGLHAPDLQYANKGEAERLIKRLADVLPEFV